MNDILGYDFIPKKKKKFTQNMPLTDLNIFYISGCGHVFCSLAWREGMGPKIFNLFLVPGCNITISSADVGRRQAE